MRLCVTLFSRNGAKAQSFLWLSAIYTGAYKTDLFQEYYSLINLYTAPAATAPRIGIKINTHNWAIAQSPTNSAWLILLAGFTEVFVTGMLMR